MVKFLYEENNFTYGSIYSWAGGSPYRKPEI